MIGEGNMEYSIGVLGSGIWDGGYNSDVQYQLNKPPTIRPMSEYRGRNII